MQNSIEGLDDNTEEISQETEKTKWWKMGGKRKLKNHLKVPIPKVQKREQKTDEEEIIKETIHQIKKKIYSTKENMDKIKQKRQA